jgi:hypothetical protein
MRQARFRDKSHVKLVIALFFVLLVQIKLDPAAGQPKPENPRVLAQVELLNPKNEQAVRLKALQWLIEHRGDKNAELSVPALERIIRKDADSKVRQEAIVALHGVAKEHRRPCPMVLIDTVLDEDVYVRQAAAALSAQFKTFPSEALPVLLRGAWSENDVVRIDCLNLLTCAAPRDERVLAVIETSKQDKMFIVRHNAHCFKFHATDRLDEFLTWIVRLQEDENGVFYPIPEDKELHARDRTARNVCIIGTARMIVDWSEQRPEELAKALLQLLEAKSIPLRRGAARLAGAASVKTTLPVPPTIEEDDPATLSFLFPDEPKSKSRNGKAAPLQQSKTGQCLERYGLRARLKKLSDQDPDSTVRRAAQQSLDRLAKIQGKK